MTIFAPRYTRIHVFDLQDYIIIQRGFAYGSFFSTKNNTVLRVDDGLQRTNLDYIVFAARKHHILMTCLYYYFLRAKIVLVMGKAKKNLRNDLRKLHTSCKYQQNKIQRY